MMKNPNNKYFKASDIVKIVNNDNFPEYKEDDLLKYIDEDNHYIDAIPISYILKKLGFMYLYRSSYDGYWYEALGKLVDDWDKLDKDGLGDGQEER